MVDVDQGPKKLHGLCRRWRLHAVSSRKYKNRGHDVRVFKPSPLCRYADADQLKISKQSSPELASPICSKPRIGGDYPNSTTRRNQCAQVEKNMSVRVTL